MEKLVIGAVIVAIIGIVWLSVVGEREWQRFAMAHHCAETHRESEVAWQYYSDGKTTSMYPIYYDHVTYQCDDGTHTHDE
jgi:hypothetical protein